MYASCTYFPFCKDTIIPQISQYDLCRFFSFSLTYAFTSFILNTCEETCVHFSMMRTLKPERRLFHKDSCLAVLPLCVLKGAILMTWQEEISIKLGRLVSIMEKQDLTDYMDRTKYSVEDLFSLDEDCFEVLQAPVQEHSHRIGFCG